jgi:hypothetical protein
VPTRIMTNHRTVPDKFESFLCFLMLSHRWVTLGLLAVENIRGAQTYNIPSPVELRYLSLQMHGSYGKETFCTMSGVQVRLKLEFCTRF